jgi:aspartyl-tRNA(Asn)/glutamyl-tRNA(Gln) amidotransferase subunit C
MNIEEKDVKHIAKLAKFELSDKEVGLYKNQLNSIFKWIDMLNEIDTSSVEATTHALGTKNVLRNDEAKNFEDREKILSLAPEREFDYIKVKKVIE